MEIYKNGEVVEPKKDELDNVIDKIDNIDRPSTYLARFKKFAPSLNMGIMDDSDNQKKFANLLQYKPSRKEGLNNYVLLFRLVEMMKACHDEIHLFVEFDMAEMEVLHFMDHF